MSRKITVATCQPNDIQGDIERSTDIVTRTPSHIGYGCSAIVSPRGEVLSRIPESASGMVIHEIAL